MSLKVKLVRVDNRLLHATVALNWSSYVNATHIILVDSFYSEDPFMENVLQLCVPKRITVKIYSSKELLEFLEQRQNDVINLIIIFKNLESLDSVSDLGFFYPEIQFPYPASKLLLKKMKAYFTEKEIALIKKLKHEGYKFYFQTTPMDSKDYSLFND